MTAAVKLQEAEAANSLVEPRFERIFGTEYAMSSPSFRHQRILMALSNQLDAQLSKHDCMPLVAPFDVYPLYENGDKHTVVQPDIFLVCDRSKLKDNSYNDAPKFIIEILSSNRSHALAAEGGDKIISSRTPTEGRHDMVTKLNLYEKAGVGEYWIVDPDAEVVTVLQLSDNGYITRAYTGKEEVRLATFPGCTVDFKKAFSELAQTNQ